MVTGGMRLGSEGVAVIGSHAHGLSRGLPRRALPGVKSPPAIYLNLNQFRLPCPWKTK